MQKSLINIIEKNAVSDFGLMNKEHIAQFLNQF